ncbi:hypothetical protein FA95DRAFT_1606107 [Auriscalpium vulgare]|uniref:Uncharacterized protein n=1 Tax=Auriscalpium vulgare TaxID=40419 RepID=A0ACB8RTG2_9AGAM|nr:hypothetical protein FA95DRAFT_1606107 [Auriscalpium vulgare]
MALHAAAPHTYYPELELHSVRPRQSRPGPQPESFTEVKELRTTFSRAIIPTTLHYCQHYRHGSSIASASSPPSASRSASTSPQSPFTSRALAAGEQLRVAHLARQHFAPAPITSRKGAGSPGNSIAHLSQLAEPEEPDDMGILSSLVDALPAVVPGVPLSESSPSLAVTDGSGNMTTVAGPTPSHARSAHLQSARLQYAYIRSPVTPRRDFGSRSHACTPDAEPDLSSSESESEVVGRIATMTIPSNCTSLFFVS